MISTRLTGWTTVEIGFQQYDVQSFPCESFGGVKHCRLVVQRQRKQKGEQLDIFDGEYIYRCILTNDWDMTDEEIIRIKATDRVKSFLFRFIAVPAKWIRTARQNVLNIYSAKPYNRIWEHG